MAGPLAGVLIIKCFNARTDAHVLHLQTRSLAEHMALGDFYDKIVGLADSFAEAYQGQYGVIDEFPLKHERATDAQDMLGALRDWIAQNRDDVCDDTYAQNIIDEIVALIQTTMYKLKYLT